MLGYMEEQLVSPLRAIRAITEHPQLSDAEKIVHIRALLTQHDEHRLASLRDEVATELSDEDYFSILEARSVRIQNRISPILKVLTFQGEAGAEALLDALQYFQDKDGAIDKHAPLAFFSPEERMAVVGQGRFRVSLYKAFLFLHTQRAIKAGTLNLEHSYKYRPLDEYLIDRERWQRDKAVLLERAGLQTLSIPTRCSTTSMTACISNTSQPMTIFGTVRTPSSASAPRAVHPENSQAGRGRRGTPAALFPGAPLCVAARSPGHGKPL